MKRIILLATILSLVILVFVGCDMFKSDEEQTNHVHSGGKATCSSLAVCDECGEQYGAKGAHAYVRATCTAPKTCTVCGTTDGSALGHNYSGATCTLPKTCTDCGVTDGYANGHNYVGGSCTEAKKCSVCGTLSDQAPAHVPLSAIRENEVYPTCTADGKYDSVVYCAVCDEELERIENIKIDALGHSYVDANCTIPKTCTVCGHSVGATSHSYNSEYSYDENGHWIECSLCGNRTDEGEHEGGEMTDTERAKCDVCSAYYGEEPGITIDWTIEPLAPANGSTFTLANERIMGWYEDYDFTTTDTDAHWLESDIFRPECPTFLWSVGENARYYKLYISKNSDMSEAQCYLTSSPRASIEHLYTGTTYYWYVDAVFEGYTVRSEKFSFNTAKTPRTVDIDGVSNARDLGGYVTTDGKVIKQGMIYRSAKLDDITELGRYTLLNVLGIKTDLDLRGYEEEAPIAELNYVPVACPWYSSGSNHIWLNDYNKEEFAKAIKVFANPDNYPVIFHCSLGRDRTGTLAMVLGGLLGLDENTLMMEYELSVFSYWGTNGSTKYNNGLRNNIHDTYLYIENNYEGDTFSEKVENFLLEIGVTAEEIDSIRSIMLEEVE